MQSRSDEIEELIISVRPRNDNMVDGLTKGLLQVS